MSGCRAYLLRKIRGVILFLPALFFIFVVFVFIPTQTDARYCIKDYCVPSIKLDSGLIGQQPNAGGKYRSTWGTPDNWVTSSTSVSNAGAFSSSHSRLCAHGICLHEFPPILNLDVKRTEDSSGNYKYTLNQNIKGKYTTFGWGTYYDDADVPYFAYDPCRMTINGQTYYEHPNFDSRDWNYSLWFTIPKTTIIPGGMIMSSGRSCAYKVVTLDGRIIEHERVIETPTPTRLQFTLGGITPNIVQTNGRDAIKITWQTIGVTKIRIECSTSYFRTCSPVEDVSNGGVQNWEYTFPPDVDPTDSFITVRAYNSYSNDYDFKTIAVKGKSALQCMGDGIAKKATDIITLGQVGLCTANALTSPPPVNALAFPSLILSTRIVKTVLCPIRPAIAGVEEGLKACGKGSPGTPESCAISAAQLFTEARLPNELEYLPPPFSLLSNATLAEGLGMVIETFTAPGASIVAAPLLIGAAAGAAYGMCAMLPGNVATAIDNTITFIKEALKAIRAIEDLLGLLKNIIDWFMRPPVVPPLGNTLCPDGSNPPCKLPTTGLAPAPDILKLGSLIVGKGCQFLGGQGFDKSSDEGSKIFADCNKAITTFALCGEAALGLTSKDEKGNVRSKGGDIGTDSSNSEARGVAEDLEREDHGFGARMAEATTNAEAAGCKGDHTNAGCGGNYMAQACSVVGKNASQIKQGLKAFMDRFAPKK